MKLSVFLMLIGMIQVSANVYSQTGKINVQVEQVSMSELLWELQEKSDAVFVFNTKDLENLPEVSIDMKDVSIAEILDKLLFGTELEYILDDDVVVIQKKLPEVIQKKAPLAEQAVQQEKKIIKGTVTDTKGEALPFVSVAFKGTNKGTITSMDGKFELETEESSNLVLVISSIGFETIEIAIQDQSELSIVLESSIAEIDEVVVTGIYNRNKESFTGAAASFGVDELKAVGSSSALQSLTTIDPSLNIVDNNLFGSDPNKLPDIEIRGKTSIMGLKEEYGTDPNQPLFILDGFETNLQTVMDLNMNRVRSVTILKDAASTAIYGSKAANGVVVIETLVPKTGKLQMSYKGDYTVTMADLSDYNLMNASEKMEFEILAGRYKSYSGDPLDQMHLDNLKNERLTEIARGVDTYWLSEPIRTGFTHKHNVFAEGGEEKIRYGIGLSFGDAKGVMKGSDRQTIGGNVDLVYRQGDFKFSNKLTINSIKSNNPNVSFLDYVNANPYFRKRQEDGTILKNLYEPIDEFESPIGNPLWHASLNNKDAEKHYSFTNNFIGEWFATQNLRARAKFGIRKSIRIDEVRISPYHTMFDDVSDIDKGTYSYLNSENLRYEGDLSMIYGRLINDVHSVNLVGGFNFSSNESMNNGYKAKGYTDDQFDAPSFTNGYPSGGKSVYNESEIHASSFYLNGGYAYDNRYLLDLNYRKDGASMFGVNKKFRNTWSVGLGWNLHNENFLEENSFFQLLKIRGSIGNPGNQNFAAYQAFSTYAYTNWLNNVFGSGVLLATIGNDNLDWQETLHYNVGTDMVLLRNKLNITADAYRKVTDPLLAFITTPSSIGTSTVAMNTGVQTVNGIESTIKVSPIYEPQNRILWNLSLNMRHSQSEYSNIGASLSALNDKEKIKPAGTTRYYDGGSPSDIWAVRSAGIDPATGKELFIKKDGSKSFTYDTSDEVVVGNSQPDLEGVFGTSFYFKGLSVSCYFRYRFGGQTFNSALFDKVENISLNDINYNQDKRALYNRWQKEGQVAEYKRISLIQRTEKSSRFVMDENTISGESINISYEIPQKIINNIGMSSLTVLANMNDFFYSSTVKEERGIFYPYAKSVSFSIAATF
ncbi:SusC/RagA family TonB-linked outer membrane protein [Saccharicrinis carchari]|nr:SusC/RagA family TonB-linked outer membrane protein [Saccharicrinis carchari]